jgi:hypothetical protein
MAVPEQWEGLVTKDDRLQTSTKKRIVPRYTEVSAPPYIMINQKLKACKVQEINRQWPTP